MTEYSNHHCRVYGSPWAGVYSTYIESGRHFGKHWHSTYGLGLLVHGAQSSASGRGKVDAYAGELITTNPGEVHDGRPLGGDARHWQMVYVDPEALTAMTGEIATIGDIEVTRPVIRDARLSRALRELLARLEAWNSLRAPTSTDLLACEESLVQTCSLLLDCYATVSPLREAGGDVEQVRDWLADTLLDPPTLSEMAAMADLSKYQLLRRFKEAYGLPPHAWLLAQRAERARCLIRTGLSLEQVAASCGFADQSHMTRIFGRHFGFTPGAWRSVAGSRVLGKS